MYTQQIPWRVNYDETEVPPFVLPDVLKSVEGTPITSVQEWEANRSALLELFRKEMYGRRMPLPDKVEYKLLSEKKNALDGLAVMQQIEMTFSMNNGKSHKAIMLLFIPASARKPVPVFTGLTFNGNHVVCNDPDILVTGSVGAEFRDFDRTYGSQARRFPLKRIMERSFAVAVCSYHDFFPDDYRGWEKSILPLFLSTEELRNERVPSLADTLDYLIVGTKEEYTLQKGETIIRASVKFFGSKKYWPYIVKHNMDVLKDPDNIPAGAQVKIPVLSPKK
jgi:hypothetical protein